jgi:hypothetical protein
MKICASVQRAYQAAVMELVWKDSGKPVVPVIEIRIGYLNQSEKNQNFG